MQRMDPGTGDTTRGRDSGPARRRPAGTLDAGGRVRDGLAPLARFRRGGLPAAGPASAPPGEDEIWAREQRVMERMQRAVGHL